MPPRELIFSMPGVADVFEAESITTVYADGFASYNLGPAVSKLALFTLRQKPVGENPVPELREITTHVVVPTKMLLEMLAGAVNQLRSGAALIKAGTDLERQQIVDLYKALGVELPA